MIIIKKEMAFLSFYLAEKEYFLNDNVRKALNCIYYLNRKRNVDKALAIHLTSEKYKKKGHDYSKKYLWKMYNTRLAHIKNGKDKFQEWSLEMRERQYGIKPKLCECGCGKEVKKNNKFIHGHHRRVISQEEKSSHAKHMRNVRSVKKENKVINFESYKNL